MTKKIVIYSGEMAGVCAALKAAEYAPDGTFVTFYVSTCV